YLHTELGTWSQGKLNAKRYLNGEIDYREWAELDCALWRGIELTKILDIIDRVEFVDGALETVARLKKEGIKVGVVSAGISLMTDRAARKLNLDLALSNEILVEDGVLTGGIITKVSLDEKPNIIKDIADSIGIPMSEVATVGDNVFDMPTESGLKIAFNPKSRGAIEVADFIVGGSDIREILKIILSE
ncbi:HAD-IB family phosphatase, partial [Candidatus Bathyarchaeota archaeon]|nr:HAD-IB family phosphatase [Candidatus Bathyarchaeota archaeon]